MGAGLTMETREHGLENKRDSRGRGGTRQARGETSWKPAPRTHWSWEPDQRNSVFICFRTNRVQVHATRRDARARAERAVIRQALCSGCILTLTDSSALVRTWSTTMPRVTEGTPVCVIKRAHEYLCVSARACPTSLRIGQCGQRIASVAVTAHGQ